jgi:putative oxidoreductase
VRVTNAEIVTSVGLMAFRCVVGIVFVAHGYNHVFGGGKIAGTASWFAGLGMRPGWLHAWTASLTELGAGALLVLGLLTPLAAAGVIGTMVVALVTNHLRNGFFIFRPGEGYEYVLTLIAAGFGFACVGSGHYSLDHAIGIFDPPNVAGLVIAVIAGFGGAALLLVTTWRPGRDRTT